MLASVLNRTNYELMKMYMLKGNISIDNC